MREINKIIIHCSATKPEQNIGVNNIRKWHTDPVPQGNGWRDVGYHYVIKLDGTLEKGRDIHETGAHAYGYNTNSIGICLAGGVDKFNNPKQNYTANQYYSLKKLLDVLCVTFPNADIIGHNDVSNKACPVFNVKEWWNGCK